MLAGALASAHLEDADLALGVDVLRIDLRDAREVAERGGAAAEPLVDDAAIEVRALAVRVLVDGLVELGERGTKDLLWGLSGLDQRPRGEGLRLGVVRIERHEMARGLLGDQELPLADRRVDVADHVLARLGGDGGGGGVLIAGLDVRLARVCVGERRARARHVREDLLALGAERLEIGGQPVGVPDLREPEVRGARRVGRGLVGQAEGLEEVFGVEGLRAVRDAAAPSSLGLNSGRTGGTTERDEDGGPFEGRRETRARRDARRSRARPCWRRAWCANRGARPLGVITVRGIEGFDREDGGPTSMRGVEMGAAGTLVRTAGMLGEDAGAGSAHFAITSRYARSSTRFDGKVELALLRICAIVIERNASASQSEPHRG